MASFSDTFTRADGAVGSDYDIVDALSGINIVSNSVQAAVGGYDCAVAVKTSVASFAADQQASIELAVAGDDYIGTGVRLDAAAGTGYIMFVNASAIDCYRYNGGAAYSSIGLSAAVSPTVGDVYTLRVVGTTLTLLENDVVLDTATDATYATGQPGISGYGTAGFRGDNFLAEDVATSSAAVTGTITASITEADIVTGGKTIVLTLTGDTWVPT